MTSRNRFLLTCVCSVVLVSGQATAQEAGPGRGTLLLAGGGDISGVILERFVELAGGTNAVIAVIPTAGGATTYGDSHPMVRTFADAGTKRVSVVHTRDRALADTEAFVRPLQEATAVWIMGGDSKLLSDAYVGTRVHRELDALLQRGGVIGGSSGGANIQGTFLARASSRSEALEDVTGPMLPAFGFLGSSVLIDAHVLRENRQFDLLRVVQAQPRFLGIGIDERTAIVVQSGSFEVIGGSYVLIYDSGSMVEGGGAFYFLDRGDRFNLRTKKADRPVQARQPLGRIQARPGT